MPSHPEMRSGACGGCLVDELRGLQLSYDAYMLQVASKHGFHVVKGWGGGSGKVCWVRSHVVARRDGHILFGSVGLNIWYDMSNHAIVTDL